MYFYGAMFAIIALIWIVRSVPACAARLHGHSRPSRDGEA
jgi:hypothetical protein